MGRRRKPRFFADGVLVVNKPEGPTSHDVVDRLRRRFRPARLGHAGTLDPFASGVLLLVFNQATRLAELLGSGDKVYHGVIALGRATDTGDPTGRVSEERPVPPLSPEQVRAALAGLEGPRMQAPPAFSAAKHRGRPLYSYARAGRPVKKPPKPIVVHQARFIALGDRELEFEMRVGRGAYVRSLAEDLARELGTVGHLQRLERTLSWPFTSQEAVELEQALTATPGELEELMLPIAEALARMGLPRLELDEDRAWQLRQGQILPWAELAAASESEPEPGQPFYVVTPQGELVAVLRRLEAGQERPGRRYQSIRVFPERPAGGLGYEASASACGAE